MSISFRLAWRNLWRHPRRTWLTVGAMVFSNIILVFLISLQVGMYGMMINNTLRAQTGHLQVQAPGYKDDHKIRQVVPDVIELAAELRSGLGTEEVAARASAFVLASSVDRTYGLQITGVEPEFESDRSGDMFVLTVRFARVDGEAIAGLDEGDGEPTGTKLALSRHQVQVLEFASEHRFFAEITDLVGVTDGTKFRNKYLKPLLNAGLLAMTVPDKPRSSKQQYVTTAAGKEALERALAGTD